MKEDVKYEAAMAELQSIVPQNFTASLVRSGSTTVTLKVKRILATTVVFR